MTTTITWEEFEKVSLITGTIVQVDDFPEARIPAYKLIVDIGNGTLKKSSARITDLYTKESLLGKQVVCVSNFPPKQIGNYISEVLATGFYNDDGHVVLAVPDKKISNGKKLA